LQLWHIKMLHIKEKRAKISLSFYIHKSFEIIRIN